MNLLAKQYLIDAIEPYVFWATLVIFLSLAVIITVMFFVKKQSFKKVTVISLIAFTVYAVAVGIFLLTLDIYKHFNAEYLGENYVDKSVIYLVLIPSLITLIVVFIEAIVLVLLSVKKKISKKAYIVTGIIAGVAVIATLITVAVYFVKNISSDGYYSQELDGASLYITTALLVVAIVVLAFVFDKKSTFKFDTKSIATAGVCIALSFVLSYIKLFKLPQGGSITLCSLFPVMLFAFMYGSKKGIIVGFIYGVMQALQDPFIIHPAQFLLDYPVAFSAVGLAGIFSGFDFLEKLPSLKFAISAIITAIFRFTSHLLSGVFAFGVYTDGNVLTYSLAYNSFVFVDMLIVILAGVLIVSNKSFMSVIKREKKENA